MAGYTVENMSFTPADSLDFERLLGTAGMQNMQVQQSQHQQQGQGQGRGQAHNSSSGQGQGGGQNQVPNNTGGISMMGMRM